MAMEPQEQYFLDPSDLLFHELLSYGDCIPLEYTIPLHSVREELAEIPESDWSVYKSSEINRRWGLSLTQHEDPKIEDLVSLRQYTDSGGLSVQETAYGAAAPHYNRITKLSPVFRDFEPYLARCHIIRLGSGGFFSPHRDSYGPGRGTFRLLALLDNCSRGQYRFLMEDKSLSLEMGRIYFINTRKEHAAFSFSENSLQLVMNVKLSRESVKQVLMSVYAK